MSDELVRLTVVPNRAEAEIVCGRLRTAGIPAFHRDTNISANLGGARPMWVDWQEVLVRQDDLANAQALIEQGGD
jgi:Putative prokaryotic signal transducing protein